MSGLHHTRGHLPARPDRYGNTGRGFPAPNGSIARSPSTTAGVIAARGRHPSTRNRGVRSSGPSRSSANPVMRVRSSLSRPVSIVRPAAWRCPPNRVNRSPHCSSAPSKSNPGMLRPEPYARSPVDREHDGRPVKRVDELRGDDADDAAVPAFAPDDQHRVRADVGVGVHPASRRRQDCRFLLLTSQVLRFELLGQALRLGGASLVGEQQQAGGPGLACSSGPQR